MGVLSFEQLSKPKLTKCQLTEDDFVYVKAATVADLIELEKRGGTQTESIALMASRCVCDETGSPIMTEEQAKSLPLDVLNKLGEVFGETKEKN